MKNNYYSVTNKSYNEAAALQQLLEVVDAAIADYVEAAENKQENDYAEFTITVGGQQTAFLLGGPQVSALHKFVEHIAAENWYTVDIMNKKVISHW